MLLALRMMEVVTTGVIRRAKLQSIRHHQQTPNLYRPDALIVDQPTVSEHWRELLVPLILAFLLTEVIDCYWNSISHLQHLLLSNLFYYYTRLLRFIYLRLFFQLRPGPLDHQDDRGWPGWRRCRTTSTPTGCHGPTQSTWPRTDHSGDHWRPVVLPTRSGASRRWWWW